MTAPFEQLVTLDDVRDFIAEGYRSASPTWSKWDRGRPLEYGFTKGGGLPLAVAEPGPLIEHAVHLAGPEGLTLQQARRVFDHLGKERFDRGLAFARGAGLIHERREKRTNRAGHPQEQVVLYIGEEG